MTQESSANTTEVTALSSSIMKVVVIEDLREVRDGLTALINGTQGFKCIGSYYSHITQSRKELAISLSSMLTQSYLSE